MPKIVFSFGNINYKGLIFHPCNLLYRRGFAIFVPPLKSGTTSSNGRKVMSIARFLGDTFEMT